METPNWICLHDVQKASHYIEVVEENRYLLQSTEQGTRELAASFQGLFKEVRGEGYLTHWNWG